MSRPLLSLAKSLVTDAIAAVPPLDTVRVPCLRKVKKGFVDLVGVDVEVKEGKEVELEERFDVLEQLLVARHGHILQ